MMETKPLVAIVHEGVDTNLITIQEEYLENSLGITWIKMRVMNHMDT